MTGATASMMQLQLFDEDGKMICEVDNDEATLESYPVKDGYRIHVRKYSLCILVRFGHTCAVVVVLCTCSVLDGMYFLVGD